MMRSDPRFDPDVDAVLAGAKDIRPLPAGVRARAIARARAGMATAAKAGFEAPLRTPRPRIVVLALAASFAIVVVAATAIAALGIRASRQSVAPVPPPTRTMPAPAAALPPPALPTSPAVDQPKVDQDIPPMARSSRPLRATTPQESYAAELELLTRAQVAYAGRDFGNALGLLAEHGRRFPSGRLTEEREALRVRSLTGAGRTEEAQRAAAAFAERFPRSVLLSRPGRVRP